MWIISSPADEGGPMDWAIRFSIARNCSLESLTCVNKGAACVIQIFDLPFGTGDLRTTTITGNVATIAAGHLFEDGDQATITDSTHTGSGFVRPLTPTTFSLYDTRAHAQDRTALTGIVSLAAIVGTITTQWTAGVTKRNDAEQALVPEEYSLAGSDAAPSNVLSYTNAKFRRGLHVRAVTALNGSTAIGSSDIKYTPRFRRGTIGS